MSINKRHVVYAGLVGLLSGCSLFSVQTGPNHSYLVNQESSQLPLRSNHHVTIGVTTPSAAPMYNSTDILYSIAPYQVAAFAKSNWMETPAQMLEPLVVRALQKTHYYSAVKTTVMGRSDYILNTDILEFMQDFTVNPSVFTVRIRGDLVRTSTNQILRTKEFSVTVPAHQNNPYGGVAAANEAVASIVRQLAWFAISAR